MSDQTSAHRCRRGTRCPRRQLEGARWLGAALDAPTGICDTDYRLLDRALGELNELWLALRMLTRPSLAAPAGPGPRGSKTPPLPLRAEPLVTAEAIHRELSGWATLTRAALNTRPPRRPDVPKAVHPDDRLMHLEAYDVGRDSQHLAMALDTLLALPRRPMRRWDPTGTREDVAHLDGADGAVILLNLHQHAIGVAGRSRLVHQSVLPCPLCDCQTLQRDNGDSDWHCASCGTLVPENKIQFFSRVLLQDLDDADACDQCDELGRRHDDPNGTLCDHRPAQAHAS
ncbi:hypothetical protein ACL02T_33035 [Pseudonocardia sp. RS010]|uniref:hypothetical protein n=1 Tax=Pseudonocardia sp. RS010 TaxID=3385979 RepID=UPI0039A03325